jgi:AcrR family transcriptional regulator
MRIPAYRRLPRAVREQQMLDAAVTVFSRRGFHAASMDEIADVAGVSKPMVYAYLGAKDDVFIACLHREVTRLVEAIVAAVQEAAPPRRQLENGLRAFFTFVAAHRDGWAVIYRQAREREPFVGELSRIRGQLVDMVLSLLTNATAVPAGDLVPVAYALVGAAESLADWTLDHRDADPDATAARLTALMWPGISASARR